MTTKRYKLPDCLGGGEVQDCMTTLAVPNGYVPLGFSSLQDDPEGWLYMVPLKALTEIPPPIPAEPEPGAYLIGGVPCIHMPRGAKDPSGYASHGRTWILGMKVPRTGWFTWEEALEVVGARPGVTITRLVPETSDQALPEVELPWAGSTITGYKIVVHAVDADGDVRVDWMGGRHVRRTTALEMAAALIAAAATSTQDGGS